MTATRAVRVLLADDHEVVRRGIRALLESERGVEVCGEAVTGRQAVVLAKELRPHVVILDISMPELNGLEAARQIRAEVPTAEILILTMHESEQIVQDVLAAGARGYILKSDAGRDLLTAVNALSEHRAFIASGVAKVVLDGYLRSVAATSEPAGPLTGREREVMQLLAEGKSNKEIAVALNITVKTAETHRANLMRKLDLHSISDLVRYAIRNNIIEP